MRKFGRRCRERIGDKLTAEIAEVAEEKQSHDSFFVHSANSAVDSLAKRPVLGLEASRNQTRALVERDIGPGPLEQDRDPIPESNKIKDVNEKPGQQGRESAKVHYVQVGDGAVAADRGHAALVPIIKALRLCVFEHEQDVLRRVAALLDRHRRNARERLAILRGSEVRQVTDHLHFGVAWNRQIVLYDNTPVAVD